MNLFKRIKRQKREKQINWFTIECGKCSHITCVEQEDIKVSPLSTKEDIQLFTKCATCGARLPIVNEEVPKKVINYVLEKAYESGKCFQL